MATGKARWGRDPRTVIWVSDPNKHYATFRGPNWLAVRDAVRARDKTCQHKGRGRCHGLLQVHHIVPYRLHKNYLQANELSNLKLLCERHHEIEDRGVGALDWHPDATRVRLRKKVRPQAPRPANHAEQLRPPPESFVIFMNQMRAQLDVAEAPKHRPTSLFEYLTVLAPLLYGLGCWAGWVG